MRGIPRSERWFEAGSHGVSESLFSSEVSISCEVDEPREVRNGSLRDLLDAEFSRNYRFEGWSDFFHDLKGFFRKVVVREPEEDFGELLPGGQDPESR